MAEPAPQVTSDAVGSPTTPSAEDSHTNAKQSLHQSLLENLDSTIARFSDDASGDPPRTPASAEESFIRTFAPKGMEESFQQLYSILNPCLCQTSSDAATASAILMGPRGSGKTLLLERCLAACQQQDSQVKFRKVMIHGIVVRGEDVPSVVHEILRQLSDLALREASSPSQNNESSPTKRRKIENDQYMLRLRRSTFTSNLALLESTLKIAEVDRIPILLVLDELDSLVDEGERQLLLYHLLDRVATPGSNLVLVGLTSSFTTLSLMEKRIRSRAEGTSKVIYVRPPTTYNQILEILEHKLHDCVVGKDIIKHISPPSKGQQNDVSELSRRIPTVLARELSLGKDLRWFSRVISSSVSLYRFDCMLNQAETAAPFPIEHLLEGMVMMGANISDSPSTSSTTQSNLCLVDNVAVDPRLQALLDLSKPQLALLLAARRILSREAHLEQATRSPLTFRRMMLEYGTFRRGVQTYPPRLLLKAAQELLQQGVLVPTMDHDGGGLLQTHVSNAYRNMHPHSFARLPLTLPVDIDRELGETLNRNLLDCSTALKEWGRKTN